MARPLGGWIHSAYGWPNYLFWTVMAGLGILISACNPFDPLRRGGAAALGWCWGRFMWWTTPFWWRDVQGLENLQDGPYVIVANHQSTIDIPCLFGLPLPVKITARPGIFRVPVMGRFLAWSGQIDTDRFFEDARAALDAGFSVVVFPEGSRSADGALQRFHVGAFRLATETGRPILPVAMDGAQDIMAKKDWFARAWWVVVRVRVLPAVPAGTDPKELAQRVKTQIDAAVARYTPQGKFAEGFARGKMKGDPAYAAVLTMLRPGMTLVDVGCGEGYLLALAAETIGGLTLIGFDHDTRRLASAEAALDGLDARLWSADARVADLPEADAICVLDVLHYQPAADQDAILARLAGALRPGGVLLVRDGRSDGGWRSGVTALSERVAIALGRHKGEGVYFRPQAELEAALRACGLDVEATACAENTPFANVLYAARRPA